MINAQYTSIADLPPEEQLIECPYNKAHKVVAKRMGNHLLKCRRSHSTAGTATCRFNLSHVIPLHEKSYHESTCPERNLIDTFLLECLKRKKEVKEEDSAFDEDFSLSSKNDRNYEFDSANVLMNRSEWAQQADKGDWDDDLPSKTYVPMQMLEKRKKEGIIIRTHIQHGLPSERRRLREELRLENAEILNKATKKEEARATATNRDLVAENYGSYHRRSTSRLRQNYSSANRPNNSAYHLH